MEGKRFLRYLAPNLVTFTSILFGLLSLRASMDGRFYDASWFVLFSVLTDKLDGFVARLVKGTSEFGVQLDSFADFLNFGIAPATIWYTFLTRAPGLSFADGRGHVILVVATIAWVLAVTFRLARYNVVGDDPNCRRIFFGVPTTLAGGCLMAFFVAALKYGGPEVQAFAQASFDEPRLLGSDVLWGIGVWKAFPVLIFLGAVLMASAVRIPKLGLSKSKALTVFIFANVFCGYVAGFSRKLPEYLTFASLLWIVASVIWGQFSAVAKSLRPPAVFPRTDRPPSQLPQRPEEDALPDDDEAHEPTETPPPAGATSPPRSARG